MVQPPHSLDDVLKWGALSANIVSEEPIDVVLHEAYPGALLGLPFSVALPWFFTCCIAQRPKGSTMRFTAVAPFSLKLSLLSGGFGWRIGLV